ncbi:MAG: FKBP-type peptidyl-prolyl cis-trans isomerase [archaeon]
MKLQKKDFIEIEFTGRTSEGEIFDSNIKEDLKKTNLETEPKPFIFSLDEGMFLKSIDDFLVGKPVPSKPTIYEISLPPEKAFGARDSQLIQIMPSKIFREHKLNPVPGVVFNFDGRIAKVLSVSSGRVIVDFNNPLAGKSVNYKINVLRKVDDVNEKVRAFMDFLFKKNFDFEIKNNKIIIETEKSLVKFVEVFSGKFKEVLGLDLEIKEAGRKEESGKKAKENMVEKESPGSEMKSQ